MVGGFQLFRVGPDVHLRVCSILRHTGDALTLPFAVLLQPQHMPVPGSILILSQGMYSFPVESSTPHLPSRQTAA